jgi:hypothetical protein
LQKTEYWKVEYKYSKVADPKVGISKVEFSARSLESLSALVLLVTVFAVVVEVDVDVAVEVVGVVEVAAVDAIARRFGIVSSCEMVGEPW